MEGVDSPGTSWRGVVPGAGPERDSDSDTDTSIDGDSRSRGRTRGSDLRTPNRLDHLEEDEYHRSPMVSGSSLPISVPGMHMSRFGENRRLHQQNPDDNFLPPHVISSSFTVASSSMFAPMYIPESVPTGDLEGRGRSVSMSMGGPQFHWPAEAPNSKLVTAFGSVGTLKGRDALRLRNQVMEVTGSIVD